MMPEAKVKQQIKKLFDKYGVWYFMPRGTSMGVSGIPDFVACMKGKFVAVEAKATKYSKVTAMQKMNMSAICEHGGTAFVVHAGNMDALESFLERENKD